MYHRCRSETGCSEACYGCVQVRRSWCRAQWETKGDGNLMSGIVFKAPLTCCAVNSFDHTQCFVPIEGCWFAYYGGRGKLKSRCVQCFVAELYYSSAHFIHQPVLYGWTCWVSKENIKGNICTVWDCYLRWADASRVPKHLAIIRFQTICVSVYKNGKNK